MKIKKNAWASAKLGDVVTKKEENDKVNAKNNFDRFLKVDHLDAESLHIKRWASQKLDELPPTFYKVFRKGQILYPTRNPHLRRTALASFDGICGEKTLTLEPVSSVVVEGFLPYLFHSDNFYSHSTSSIIGSTNPHVRWRDLAKFDFKLPPKDEQRELVKLLRSADDALESLIKSRDLAKLTLASEIEFCVHGTKLDGQKISEVLKKIQLKTPVANLKELGSIFKGKGIPKSQVIDSGIPCVRYGELYTKHHRIIRNFYSFINNESSKNAVLINKNDALFAGSGETITEIGKAAVYTNDEEAYAGSDILIFRPKDMDGKYLGYLLNSQLVRQQLNKLGTGATVMHVYADDIGKIQIPVHSINEQIKISEHLEIIQGSIFTIEKQIEANRELFKSLINKVF